MFITDRRLDKNHNWQLTSKKLNKFPKPMHNHFTLPYANLSLDVVYVYNVNVIELLIDVCFGFVVVVVVVTYIWESQMSQNMIS
jgi:hypothetical protein